MATVAAPDPLPQWWVAACRVYTGLQPRTPRPAGMPKPAPAWAVQEWATWSAWNAWKNAGGHAPKPAFSWLTPMDGKRAPLWARRLRGEWLKVHGIPAPPTDPERPECRWTTEQIGGFGLRIDDHMFSRGGWTPEGLVERVKNAREPHAGQPLRYLSIEGYPASDGTMFNGYSVDNEPFMDRFIAACHGAKRTTTVRPLEARIWERTDQIQAVGGFAHIKRILTAHPGFDVYEADLEDMDKVDPTIAAQFAAEPLTKDMPRSTLYAGMWDARYYDPWIKAQFAAGIQAYSHEDWPGGFPISSGGIAGSMERGAYWRGCLPIPGLNGLCAIPMIGVNVEGDGGLAHQLPTLVQFDGNYGIEFASLLKAGDFAAMGI